MRFSRFLWSMVAAFAVLPAFTLDAASQARQTVELVVPQDAPGPVRFGAGELRRALGERPGVVPRIVIGTGKAPGGPESYSITVQPGGAVEIEGSDATGTMYGALELAEQIGAGQIKAVRKSPYLALRGVNMFLTVQDVDDPASAYWSDSFWEGFLGMLARDRYNLLDIHGLCDAVSLGFPNTFAHLVSLAEFPEVGVGPARAAKNMARFQQVIRMAADRGIKVAYMNYFAAPTIGPWKTLRYGQDERWTQPRQGLLTGPRLEDYTRKAVSAFLKQVPELWMFGFRIGESGQPEDFYQKTYLAALADVPDSLNLYVRTWIADPAKVRELARSTKHHLYIEPKYNGEQLGLPYQAALGGRQYPPSGSYEDYTNRPQNYSILWQIRAHGTHRVFYWGWPEYARRTVRSCKFGDSAGFSMEPMSAYCPENDYLHNNPNAGHRPYKWIYERQWLWHMVWGRTAYDPEVSDEVWRWEFERRFGPRAGLLVYKALVENSKIVPFIYSYHSVGLDHQDFAPEFETGDHAFGARTRLWQGERLVPYGGNNDDFLRVQPLDRTAMADPASYVDRYLRRLPDARMSPEEAARYLGSAADTSEQIIKEAAQLGPQSPDEFDCIRKDVEAVGWLGRYYRDRIISATHFEFYRRTSHHPELSAAHQYLKRAADAWDRLSNVTQEHFGYVPENIRMGVSQFHWREEGRNLGVDLDQINNLEHDFFQFRNRRLVTIGHMPPLKARPGQALPLTVTCTPSNEAGQVLLFYRNSRRTAFTTIALRPASRVERTWRGEIPAEEVVPGSLEYYFELHPGLGGPYGSTVENHPPYSVVVTANDAKPVLSHQPPAGAVRGGSVELTVDVTASGKLASVRVWYKRMPAYHEWVKLEMQPAGGNRYRAQVPLTPEGILYYFEASDQDANAANHPDFLKQTPYFVIDGWKE